MKKLIYLSMAALMVLAAVSCEKTGSGNSGNNEEQKIVGLEEAVNLGIVLPCRDASGNALKDEEGNVITYKLYWAKSNLSESGPCATAVDYGDYYAWGETMPYDTYTWASYKFRISGDSWDNVKFSRYVTDGAYGEVDNLTVLQRGEKEGETKDDVARDKLGGKWRMPTYAEWEALRAQGKWVMMTQSGIDGHMVYAANGNSIFLPYAGNWHLTDLVGTGQAGAYWSSSLYTQASYAAWAMYFNADGVDMFPYDRYHGMPIRPVWEEINAEDPVEESVWYTHSEEDDVEQGHQDIVWKLVFSADSKASITGTANDEVFSQATGTYSASGSKPIQLSLSCKQPERTLVFKAFSALADGRWKLDVEIHYDYGTIQTFYFIFVNGRIPAPYEVMGL